MSLSPEVLLLITDILEQDDYFSLCLTCQSFNRFLILNYLYKHGVRQLQNEEEIDSWPSAQGTLLSASSSMTAARDLNVDLKFKTTSNSPPPSVYLSTTQIQLALPALRKAFFIKSLSQLNCKFNCSTALSFTYELKELRRLVERLNAVEEVILDFGGGCWGVFDDQPGDNGSENDENHVWMRNRVWNPLRTGGGIRPGISDFTLWKRWEGLQDRSGTGEKGVNDNGWEKALMELLNILVRAQDAKCKQLIVRKGRFVEGQRLDAIMLKQSHGASWSVRKQANRYTGALSPEASGTHKKDVRKIPTLVGSALTLLKMKPIKDASTPTCSPIRIPSLDKNFKTRTNAKPTLPQVCSSPKNRDLSTFHIHSDILFTKALHPWTINTLNSSAIRTLSLEPYNEQVILSTPAATMAAMNSSWSGVLQLITIPGLTKFSARTLYITFPDLIQFVGRHEEKLESLEIHDKLLYPRPSSNTFGSRVGLPFLSFKPSLNLNTNQALRLPNLTTLSGGSDILAHFLSHIEIAPKLTNIMVRIPMNVGSILARETLDELKVHIVLVAQRIRRGQATEAGQKGFEVRFVGEIPPASPTNRRKQGSPATRGPPFREQSEHSHRRTLSVLTGILLNTEGMSPRPYAFGAQASPVVPGHSFANSTRSCSVSSLPASKLQDASTECLNHISSLTFSVDPSSAPPHIFPKFALDEIPLWLSRNFHMLERVGFAAGCIPWHEEERLREEIASACTRVVEVGFGSRWFGTGDVDVGEEGNFGDK